MVNSMNRRVQALEEKVGSDDVELLPLDWFYGDRSKPAQRITTRELQSRTLDDFYKDEKENMMKKSIIDRIAVLESSYQTANGEKQSPLISACFDAVEKFFPNVSVDAKVLAPMVQRIKEGMSTVDDRALLDELSDIAEKDVAIHGMPKAGMTALQFIEALLHLEENY